MHAVAQYKRNLYLIFSHNFTGPRKVVLGQLTKLGFIRATKIAGAVAFFNGPRSAETLLGKLSEVLRAATRPRGTSQYKRGSKLPLNGGYNHPAR